MINVDMETKRGGAMKEQQRLLQEIALMLEHQDMLSKLTESQCLDEYGYCLLYTSPSPRDRG